MIRMKARLRRVKPGTLLAKTFKRIGISPCGGCNKRAKKLDKVWSDLVK